jgi:hypothetical protein
MRRRVSTSHFRLRATLCGLLWWLAVLGCGGRGTGGGDAGGDAPADAADAGDAAGFHDAADAGPMDVRPADAEAGGLIGAPCERNADCRSAQCLTDEVAVGLGLAGVHTNGGYCVLFPCMGSAQCGPRAHCESAAPFGASISLCLQSCGSPAECTRPGYQCFFGPGVDAGPAAGSCVPEDLPYLDAGS